MELGRSSGDMWLWHPSLKLPTTYPAWHGNRDSVDMKLLQLVAGFHANILTIHQSIPVNGVASISLSVEVLEETGNIDNMVRDIESCNGIYDVKILARK